MTPGPISYNFSQSVPVNFPEPVSLSPKELAFQCRITPSIIVLFKRSSRCELELVNHYHVAAGFLSLWRCWNCYSTLGLGGFDVLVIHALYYTFVYAGKGRGNSAQVRR